MGNLTGKEEQPPQSRRNSAATPAPVGTARQDAPTAMGAAKQSSPSQKASSSSSKATAAAPSNIVAPKPRQGAEGLRSPSTPRSAGDDAEAAEDSKSGDGDVLDELDQDNSVPMVFRWDGGGRNVYITGTFNKWSEKIPMRRSGNDFLYIRDLKKGRHAYKFIVDDEWRFAPDQPTVADPHGYINNFVDLTNFEGTFGQSMKPLSNQDHITEDSLYTNFCPDPSDPQFYAKEPPPLPPHLRQIILNTPRSNDCLAAKSMQVPQHVTLNHLYCSAIKENLMVLAVSQRYREKFVTTVFYSPLPEAHVAGRLGSPSDAIDVSPKTMMYQAR